MKKLNNKGFSLVELIIVIAIMAILVGVVGTQVIPYLENSRKAKDIQILSAWNTAAVSAYSTEAGSLNATSTYTIHVTTSGITVTSSNTADTTTALKTTFLALTDLKDAAYSYTNNMSSKAGKSITDVKIEINGGNGQVVTEVANCGSGYSFDAIENK